MSVCHSFLSVFFYHNVFSKTVNSSCRCHCFIRPPLKSLGYSVWSCPVQSTSRSLSLCSGFSRGYCFWNIHCGHIRRYNIIAQFLHVLHYHIERNSHKALGTHSCHWKKSNEIKHYTGFSLEFSLWGSRDHLLIKIRPAWQIWRKIRNWWWGSKYTISKVKKSPDYTNITA